MCDGDLLNITCLICKNLNTRLVKTHRLFCCRGEPGTEAPGQRMDNLSSRLSVRLLGLLYPALKKEGWLCFLQNYTFLEKGI